MTGSRTLIGAIGLMILATAGVSPAAASTIAGRIIFYNFSAFDGFDSGISALDDGAIAVDKTALLPGQTATFANYTSYEKGINGIMIDLGGTIGAVSASDFSFRTGTSADPTTWAAAAAPLAVAVRAGAGGGGSNRVELTWADFAIANTWLQVTVLATVATGLADADVFYFGNLIGEVGDDPSAAAVTATDLSQTHANHGAPVLVTYPYDVNRDGSVDTADDAIVSAHLQNTLPLFEAPPTGGGTRPIPEPGSLALFAFGLAGLGYLRRRKA